MHIHAGRQRQHIFTKHPHFCLFIYFIQLIITTVITAIYYIKCAGQAV